MANKRISELNEVTTPQNADVFAIVDSGETKKITFANLALGVVASLSSLWTRGEHIALAVDNETFTLANAPSSFINLSVDRQPQIYGLDYTGTVNGANKTFIFISTVDSSLRSLIYADYL